MATDTEGLILKFEARITDFERAVKKIDRDIAKMAGRATDQNAKISRSAEAAARRYEAAFEKANRGVTARLKAVGVNFSQVLGGLGSAVGVGSLGGVAGLLGGAGIAVGVSAINEAAKSITELRAQARRAGVDFETFQRLGYAAESNLISIDALTDGIKELQLRADEFIVTGAGSGADSFRRLGYSATDLAERLKDPVELFFDLWERVKDFDRAAQIRIFDELLGGTGGEQLVQALAEGPEAFRREMDKAVVITEETADRAAEVNRRFHEIADTIDKNVKIGLIGVSDTVGDIALGIGRWTNAVDRFIESAAKGRGSLTEWFGDLLRPGGSMRAVADIGRGAVNAATGGLGLEWQQTTEGVRKEIERLEADLAQVNEFLKFPDASYGEEMLERVRRNAEDLKQQLQAAKDLLATMGSGIPTLTVNPAAPAAPPIQNTNGLNQNFRSSLEGLAAAAREAGHEITVNSGFRSVERQQQLWEAAVKRYGSESAARRWVAPPGRSNHNFGLAADLGYSSDAARQWAHQNAAQFSLNFPLGNEPWHIEPMGPDGGRVRGGNAVPAPADRTAIVQQRAQEAEKAQEAAQRQAEAIRAVNEAIQEGIELEQIRAKLLAEGKTPEEVNAALAQESEYRQRLNQLTAAGVAIDEEYAQKLREQIALKYEKIAANDQEEASVERLQQANEELKNAVEAVGQPIADAFLSIVDGSAKAEDALKRLALQLANMVIQGALFGGGPLGQSVFGGGLLGAVFGGGKAVGGPVSAGTAYMVGERGRELFVPDQDGQIITAERTRALLNSAARPVTGGGAASASGKMDVRVFVDQDGNWQAAVEKISRRQAASVSESSLQRYDKSLHGGALMRRISNAQERI